LGSQGVDSGIPTLAFRITCRVGCAFGCPENPRRLASNLWNSSKIHVQRTFSKGEFGPPKTEQSDRFIDISSSLMFELKKWKFACPKNEYDSVFPSPEGFVTCHDNVIKRYFDSALRQAGLRHVTFHSLRHSNASIRIRAGQNIKYIQSQMGHASIQVTMDIYAHLFEDSNFDRQQVELMDGFFNSVRKSLENDAENKIGVTV
jgi:integrase